MQGKTSRVSHLNSNFQYQVMWCSLRATYSIWQSRKSELLEYQGHQLNGDSGPEAKFHTIVVFSNITMLKPIKGKLTEVISISSAKSRGKTDVLDNCVKSLSFLGYKWH